jgi:hypothetical protein
LRGIAAGRDSGGRAGQHDPERSRHYRLLRHQRRAGGGKGWTAARRLTLQAVRGEDL